MPKIKSHIQHAATDVHHHGTQHHHNHISMDGVKIKRVKRNKKKITTTEKIVAGLGVGSTLMGGMGAAVKPAPQTTQFVRVQTKQQSGAGSKIKSALGRIFGSTFGAPQAKADSITDAINLTQTQINTLQAQMATLSETDPSYASDTQQLNSLQAYLNELRSYAGDSASSASSSASGGTSSNTGNTAGTSAATNNTGGSSGTLVSNIITNSDGSVTYTSSGRTYIINPDGTYTDTSSGQTGTIDSSGYLTNIIPNYSLTGSGVDTPPYIGISTNPDPIPVTTPLTDPGPTTGPSAAAHNVGDPATTDQGRAGTWQLIGGVWTIVENAGHDVQNPNGLYYTSDGNNGWNLTAGQSSSGATLNNAFGTSQYTAGDSYSYNGSTWTDTTAQQGPQVGQQASIGQNRLGTYEMINGTLTLVDNAGNQVVNPNGLTYTADGLGNWTLTSGQSASGASLNTAFATTQYNAGDSYNYNGGQWVDQTVPNPASAHNNGDPAGNVPGTSRPGIWFNQGGTWVIVDQQGNVALNPNGFNYTADGQGNWTLVDGQSATGAQLNTAFATTQYTATDNYQTSGGSWNDMGPISTAAKTVTGITISAGNLTTIPATPGGSFSPPSAVVTYSDGSTDSNYTVSGSVNPAVAGSYALTYTAGSISQPLTVTVTAAAITTTPPGGSSTYNDQQVTQMLSDATGTPYSELSSADQGAFMQTFQNGANQNLIPQTFVSASAFAMALGIGDTAPAGNQGKIQGANGQWYQLSGNNWINTTPPINIGPTTSDNAGLTAQNVNSILYDGSSEMNTQINALKGTINSGSYSSITPGTVLAEMLGLGTGSGMTPAQTIVGTDGNTYVWSGSNFIVQTPPPQTVNPPTTVNFTPPTNSTPLTSNGTVIGYVIPGGGVISANGQTYVDPGGLIYSYQAGVNRAIGTVTDSSGNTGTIDSSGYISGAVNSQGFIQTQNNAPYVAPTYAPATTQNTPIASATNPTVTIPVFGPGVYYSISDGISNDVMQYLQNNVSSLSSWLSNNGSGTYSGSIQVGYDANGNIVSYTINGVNYSPAQLAAAVVSVGQQLEPLLNGNPAHDSAAIGSLSQAQQQIYILGTSALVLPGSTLINIPGTGNASTLNSGTTGGSALFAAPTQANTSVAGQPTNVIAGFNTGTNGLTPAQANAALLAVQQAGFTGARLFNTDSGFGGTFQINSNGDTRVNWLIVYTNSQGQQVEVDPLAVLNLLNSNIQPTTANLASAQTVASEPIPASYLVSSATATTTSSTTTSTTASSGTKTTTVTGAGVGTTATSLQFTNLSAADTSNFYVGENWQLTITGPPGQQVFDQGGIGNNDQSITSYGNIGSNGTLTLTGTMTAGEVGPWSENWYVGGQLSNGQLTGSQLIGTLGFNVINGTRPATSGGIAGNSTTGGTTGGTTGTTTTFSTPSISSLSVSHAPAGSAVTISGSNFSTTAFNNAVVFTSANGATQEIPATLQGSNTLQFTVPSNLPAGAYTIKVIDLTNIQQTSNSLSFTIDPISSGVGAKATTGGTGSATRSGSTAGATSGSGASASSGAFSSAATGANATGSGSSSGSGSSGTVTQTQTTILILGSTAPGWNSSADLLTMNAGSVQQISASVLNNGLIDHSVSVATPSTNILINNTSGVITIVGVSPGIAYITVHPNDLPSSNTSQDQTITVNVIASASATGGGAGTITGSGSNGSTTGGTTGTTGATGSNSPTIVVGTGTTSSVTISSTPTTAWFLVNGQQITVYAGSDGNYYLSPTSNLYYPASALTFTNPNTTATLSISTTALTAWLLSNGQQVTVYQGSDGNYYSSPVTPVPTTTSVYPASALAFTNPTSATGTLSLSNNSINLGILSQDASIIATETVNGVTDSNLTLTISNTSIIASAVINPSSGVITITAGDTSGLATITVHPNGLGTNTSQDQIITVNVTSFTANGGGGGISYGPISYGSGTGISTESISALDSVASQPFVGLQMPPGYLASGPGSLSGGLQMPTTINLSATYANVGGTIYNKITGQAFSTPQQFFAAAGVSSFNGLIFDTTWQPGQAQGASVAVASTSSTSYTVKKGDTLWNIAKKFYGSGTQWRTIYTANLAKIPGGPKKLKVGSVLTIPSINQ